MQVNFKSLHNVEVVSSVRQFLVLAQANWAHTTSMDQACCVSRAVVIYVQYHDITVSYYDITVIITNN